MPSPTKINPTVCCTTTTTIEPNIMVRGRVMNATGVPVSGATIRAYNAKHGVELDTLTPLSIEGETAATSASGCYQIEIKTGRVGALVIRATKDSPALDISSSVYFQATGEFCIDLVTGTDSYVGPSEIKQVKDIIAAAVPDVELHDYDAGQTKHVAGKTGIHPDLVAFAAQDARLSTAHPTIPPGLFYVLFRQGLPTDLTSLLAQGESAWRRAIADAIAANVVEAPPPTDLETAITALRELQIDSLMMTPTSGSNLRTLLDHTGLIEADIRDVMSRFLTRTGTMAEFWTDIATDYDAAKIQFVLHAGTLTGNHDPLVAHLVGLYTAPTPTITSIRDLVVHDASAWKSILTSNSIPIPDQIVAAPDATDPDDDRANQYATILRNILEDAFPTPVLAARIAAENPTANADLISFFTACPDFEIDTGNVASTVDGATLPSGADIPTLKGRLEKIQRLARVVPRHGRYEQIVPLMERGFTSAASIATTGFAAFSNRVADDAGLSAKAQEIFDQAHTIHSTAMAVGMRHAAATHDVNVGVMRTRTDAPDGYPTDFPSYASLFGSADYCQCKDCQSVYSPAAYLVDLLHFLDKRRTVSGTETILAALTASTRRPDLTEIELSCPNTNTVVPYIDLVNEILEQAVSPGESGRQTTGTVAELSAEPEHTNASAYDDLATALHPWQLPFNLGLEESRAYLRHLGVDSSELMRVFQTAAETADQGRIDRERIGLSYAESTAITNVTPDNVNTWGLASVSGTSPNESDLSHVGTFLKHSGLAFDDLAPLFRTRWVNQNPATANIAVVLGEDPCKLEDATISHLDSAALHRIQRFVRLQRCLGWSAADLDRVIYVLRLPPTGALDIHGGVIGVIANLLRLQSETRLPIEELIAWIAPLGTYADSGDSQYVRVFQNREVFHPVDAGLDLNSSHPPTDLATTSGAILPSSGTSVHLDAICAGLGISTTELEQVVSLAVPNVLNLDNLSTLYRHVSAARALGISIQEYVRLCGYVGNQNWQANAGAALSLLREIRAMKGSRGFSAAEIGYLIYDDERPGDGVKPTADDIDKVLADLHAKVAAVPANANSVVYAAACKTAALTVLAAKLGISSDVVDKLASEYLHAPSGPLAIAALLDAGFIGTPFVAGGNATQVGAYLKLHRASLLIARLGILVVDLECVFGIHVDGWLAPDLIPSSATDAGYAALARLRDVFVLRDAMVGTKSSICDLIVTARSASPGSIDAFGAKLLARALWDDKDVPALITAFTPTSTFYPNDFEDEIMFRRLHEAMTVLKRIGARAEDVLDWTANMVTSGTELATAARIRRAVRSRYDEAGWRAVAKPIRDVIRQKQRDALASYVAFSQGLASVDDLFAHYLVDPKMCACGQTSRIRLALNSVQTFVQRVLMNLEDGIRLSPEDAKEWAWMKTYSVWASNRQVFLYPENWLDPTLRTGKTPFFTDFESSLQQNEARSDTVPNAFSDYLAKLETIARLEVVASVLERDEEGGGAPDVLHAFARTMVSPKTYFYRRYVEDEGWTGWEQVELDFKDAMILPVVFNRRLRIYWPETVIRGADANKPLSESDQGSLPVKMMDVRLAFSEYRNGRWSAKKISDVVETLSSGDDPANRIDVEQVARDMFFRATDQDGDLTLTLWVPDNTDNLYISYTVLRVLTVPDGVGPITSGPPDRPIQSYLDLLGPPGTIAVGGHYTPPSSVDAFTNHRLEVPFVDAAGTPCSAVALDQAKAGYELTTVSTSAHFDGAVPFFYQDTDRAFFVTRHSHPYEEAVASLQSPQSASLDSIDHALHVHLNPDGVPLPETGLRGGTHSRIVTQSFTGNRAQSPITLGLPSRAAISRTARERLPGMILPRMVQADTGTSTLTSGPPEVPSLLNPSTHTLRRDEYIVGIDVSGSVASIIGPPELSAASLPARETYQYRFATFYHPYVRDMARQLNRFGVAGLLAPPPGSDVALDRQEKSHEFFDSYAPNDSVVYAPGPKDEIDFDADGAYSAYNWELFFYAPFMIAERLRANRQFAEAQRWYHFIFDPTSADTLLGRERYWRTRPLFEETTGASIDELLLLLHATGTSDEQRDLRERIERQVTVWRRRPFDPDVIAHLRPTAFQKAVVMRYLDNLIEWGDDLFRQDTIETINQATQLYLLAAQILGDRPVVLPGEEITPQTYNGIKNQLDEFSDAIVRVEQHLPPSRNRLTPPRIRIPDRVASPSLHAGMELYFCVPPNDRLLAYWDRIADRLFKIRNCLNIEGVAQTLPLFEPPIDPALLVRAAAHGVTLESAIAEASAAPPPYRFSIMYQRAVEFCGDVRSLGGALLSALEKRDGETLAALRSTHEVDITKATRKVRDDQLADAKAARAALDRSREVAQARSDYYEGLIKTGINELEKIQLGSLELSGVTQTIGQSMEMMASFLSIIPQFELGASGWAATPVGTVAFGGVQIGAMAAGTARSFEMVAGLASHVGSVTGMMAGWQRRSDEWQFQADVAKKDLAQIDAQLAAADIRIALAEHERDVQDKQIELAQAADEYLQGKYTQTELYDWMSRELTSLYTQAYQLAMDLAKRAEHAWFYDLGEFDASQSFIQQGHWEDRRTGLLAGERLLNDLRRMEAAYLSKNTRQFEITKHISLSQLDPVALHSLRTKGTCSFDVPEVLFDVDFPDHYLRRVKSVAVTMPGVSGPYTSVPCRVDLSSSKTRRKSDDTGLTADDVTQSPAPHAIVTSHAQSDGGLFETNHHDERYLPFEGCGVVGTWTLTLPSAFCSFDYETISDVVLTVRYTARDGRPVPTPQSSLVTSLEASLNLVASRTNPAVSTNHGLFRAFSMRQDFPDQWEAFVHPTGTTASTATLPITADRFPAVTQGKTIGIGHVYLILPVESGVTLGTPHVTMSVGHGTTTDISSIEIQSDTGVLNGVPQGAGAPSSPFAPNNLIFTVTNTADAAVSVSGHAAQLDPAKVRDLIVIVQYTLS